MCPRVEPTISLNLFIFWAAVLTLQWFEFENLIPVTHNQQKNSKNWRQYDVLYTILCISGKFDQFLRQLLTRKKVEKTRCIDRLGSGLRRPGLPWPGFRGRLIASVDRMTDAISKRYVLSTNACAPTPRMNNSTESTLLYIIIIVVNVYSSCKFLVMGLFWGTRLIRFFTKYIKSMII